MKEYIKILFTKGLNTEAFQEIEDGQLIRYCDENGKTIDLPEVTESKVIEVDAKPNFIIK